MAGSAYVFTDKAWWRDTLSITSSLNIMGLMAGTTLKQKKFRYLIDQKWISRYEKHI